MSERILYAFYDLDVCPVSFDFAVLTACAGAYRQKHGYDGVHFVVVPVDPEAGHWDVRYRSKHHNPYFSVEHAHWRINNLFYPIVALLPANRGLTVCTSREEAQRIWDLAGAENVFPERYRIDYPVEHFFQGWPVLYAHAGDEIQCFRSDEQARAYVRQWLDTHSGGRKAVAITLREAQHEPIRNSDPDAWSKFARRLAAEGYFPVLVRDIDTALGPPSEAFAGITNFPEAAFNIDLRMALYEECDIATFVANGPATLCFYNRNVHFLYVVSGDWLKRKPTPFQGSGIEFGETPPFSTRFQRWIWKEQSADMLWQEFKDLERKMEEARRDGTYEAGLRLDPDNSLPLEVFAARFEERIAKHWLLTPHEEHVYEACRRIIGRPHNDDFFNIRRIIKFAIEARDFDRAIDLMKTFGAQFGYTSDLFGHLGAMHELLERTEKAIDYYERALAEKPDSPSLIFRLGVMANRRGSFNEARGRFESLIKRGARHRNLFFELGQTYEALGWPGKARDIYRAAQRYGIADAAFDERLSILAEHSA